jgi:NTE family protein
MENQNIKHLVLAGGGTTGMTVYGILRESEKAGFWNIENIESIYGTSVGSMISVFVALKYDWDVLDDYIIKRPWQNVYKFDFREAFSALQNRGIFNIKIIEETFLPLFRGKDIDMNVTMKEFYDITKIEIHIFATEMNEFQNIDISYKTHPEFKLIEAVYSSCCLPIIFSPLLIQDRCYIDGGILCNYPLSHCLNNVENSDEIFGMNIQFVSSNSKINSESSIFDYIFTLLNKIVANILFEKKKISIKHEIIINKVSTSLYEITSVAASSEERVKLIECGAKLWMESEFVENLPK